MDANSSLSSLLSHCSVFKPWTGTEHHQQQENRHHPHSPLSHRRASSLLKAVTLDVIPLYRRCNPDFQFVHAVPRRCLTKPSDAVYNHEWDNRYHDYILYVNDVLDDDRGNQFTVLDLLGTGTFGQVVKCLYQNTGEVVAVKVIKNQPAYFNQAWVEINILRMLHRNNRPDHTRHIVKFYSHFVFRGHLCLVFERLSINLYELLKQNSYAGIGLDLLRNFVTQILQALLVLVRSEVIHCDLKPENILVKALDTTELKLIDFGSACQLHYPVYSYVQSRFYRSPEVLLGWPKYDSKIDMWSLGCVVAELFLGIPLFPGQNEMNMICRIVEMLGDMPDRFLQHCRHTQKFYNGPNPIALNLLQSNTNHVTNSPDMRVYQLKPISQYEQENSISLPEWKRFFKEKTLRDIIMTYPKRSPPPHSEEISLRESLIDLLNGMLKIDPRDRWTPSEVLQHPFLNGQSLPNGQPWVPPTRPRRFNRSRPVNIGHGDAHDDDPAQHGTYSASAPNFNARGPLAFGQPRWPTSITPADDPSTPTAIVGTPDDNANAQYARPFAPYAPSGAYSLASDSDVGSSAHHASAFTAPGSYIPPSVLSTFSSTMPLQPLQSVRSAQGGMSVGSYDARPLVYAPPADVQLQPQQSQFQPQLRHNATARAVTDSPSGVMALTPPVAYGVSGSSTARIGNLGGVSAGLPVSTSRESLTGSLQLSPSKDSGMGREASATDLYEDGMFAYGSDDDAFNASGQPSVPIGHTGGGHFHQLATASGSASHPGSAALPPAGPRLGGSSRGVPSFGNPSTLPSYGYAYDNFQQQQQHSNSFRPSVGTDVGVAIPGTNSNADVAMTDSNSLHSDPSSGAPTQLSTVGKHENIGHTRNANEESETK